MAPPNPNLCFTPGAALHPAIPPATPLRSHARPRHTRPHTTRRHAPTMQAERGRQPLATSAAVAAAAASAAAVNAEVATKRLAAPDDAAKSFVSRRPTSSAATPSSPSTAPARSTPVDAASGLPLEYDKVLIEAHWARSSSALQARWRDFLSVSAPFLARVAATLIRSGADGLAADAAALTRDARERIERLGPTFVKAAQMMSVRPDVLPPAALRELAVLQDSVTPFDSAVARATVERELGRPLEEVFADFPDDPVAAASLAQVYRATLHSGRRVAVKVQRPDVLETVSKDLYVLRRAAEVYQGLMDRYTKQTVDYIALLNEWAIGFYTELDFANEGANQTRLRKLLAEHDVKDVYVPEVYHELCTRRVLVTEWMDGRKLSQCSGDELRELTAIGQECFLVQLLQLGFLHADPHPGNLLRLDDQSKGRLALLDFGLVASLQQEDIDQIVSALIHLANRDYAALVDDFIALKILPADCDRRVVLPLMDKALSPYVKGGGARRYEEEVRRMYGMGEGSGAGAAVGGFQAMTRDAVTVFNDVPFSIPPYFALVGRAIVTLEGLALQGNPDYALVMESYPFVARKLLRDDRPSVQRALQDVLYGGGASAKNGAGLSGMRLAALLSGALGAVARSDGGAFVDLDALPEDGLDLPAALRKLLGPDAESLRAVLRDEVDRAADVLFRQAVRKAYAAAVAARPRAPLPALDRLIPTLETMPGPVLLPTKDGSVRPAFTTAARVVEAVAPRLDREEELYALSLIDVVKASGGEQVAAVAAGDAFGQPAVFFGVVGAMLRTGRVPGTQDLPPVVVSLMEQASSMIGGDSLLSRRGGEQKNEEKNLESGALRGEMYEALDALDEAERTVLDEEVREIGNRLWKVAAERLERL